MLHILLRRGTEGVCAGQDVGISHGSNLLLVPTVRLGLEIVGLGLMTKGSSREDTIGRSTPLISSATLCAHADRPHLVDLRRPQQRCEQPIAGNVDGAGVGLVGWVRDVEGATCRTARVWDVETGQCKHILGEHQHGVAVLALSPTLIITGSQDKNINFWQDGKKVLSYPGHDGIIAIRSHRHNSTDNTAARSGICDVFKRRDGEAVGLGREAAADLEGTQLVRLHFGADG